MPIHFTYKPAPPSNKSETTPQTVEQGGARGPNKGPDPTPLIPFIDRISVALVIPQVEDQIQIYQQLIGTKLDDEVMQLMSPPQAAGHKQKKWRIKVPGVVSSEKWPFLQCDYQFGDSVEVSKASRLRIEFNVVDLGGSGLKQLDAILKSLVPDGWGYFIKYGRVSTIEVTVDIPGLGMEEFHVLPPQGVSSKTFLQNGKLQTLYLGKKEGNQTRIYDNAAKRVAKGQNWPGPPTVRIERKLKLGKTLSLPGLAQLTNPFAGIKVTTRRPGYPPQEIETKAYLWALFLDSAEVRNLNAALQLLPEKKRALYRKWLKQCPQNWWDPEAIWAHWPKVIDDTLLTSKALM